MTEQIRDSRLTLKETHLMDSKGDVWTETASEEMTILGVLGVTKFVDYLDGSSLD